jgi:pilus assembly protein CpaF
MIDAWILRISGPDGLDRTVEIARGEAVLGKHPECDVVLSDPKVSRRHARLVIEPEDLWLEDLGSANGTTVGGKPVTERLSLAPEDEIVIGPFRIRAERLSQAREAETRPRVGDAGTVLGPLAPLFADARVTEIMVNGPEEIYVERGGRLEPAEARFASTDDLLELIRSIARGVGRAIDDAQPMLDARLSDGSRVNAVLTPLAVRGPYLTIRRFPSERLTAEQLVELGALSPPMLSFLRAAVGARLNLLVSGGSGSGKTTLLNALCAFFGTDERIITIEDAAELRLPQRHVLPLETRPPQAKDGGEITTRDLVRNALRMRPDRIVVGEVRGGEALDMLQAMNTGHEGSLATIHANSPRNALSRLETLSLFAGFDLPPRALREQIAGAITLVVQVSRAAGGKRRVVSVTELTGMEGDQFTMGEIFACPGAAGEEAVHRATGYVPRCREVMLRRGREVDNGWFRP